MNKYFGLLTLLSLLFFSLPARAGTGTPSAISDELSIACVNEWLRFMSKFPTSRMRKLIDPEFLPLIETPSNKEEDLVSIGALHVILDLLEHIDSSQESSIKKLLNHTLKRLRKRVGLVHAGKVKAEEHVDYVDDLMFTLSRQLAALATLKGDLQIGYFGYQDPEAPVSTTADTAKYVLLKFLGFEGFDEVGDEIPDSFSDVIIDYWRGTEALFVVDKKGGKHLLHVAQPIQTGDVEFPFGSKVTDLNEILNCRL